MVCLIAGGAVEALAQGNGGTIKGKVQITGKLPGNSVIRMGVDPMCSKANAGKRVIQETFVATADGSLANVFVRVKGNFPQTPPPPQPVVIDQHNCVYFPRVVGARVGQKIQIKNSDNFMHNVDALSGKSNGFNIAQPRAGLVYEFKPKNEEVMMHVKCDVHSWMNLYIGIVANPYFAVSDAMGGFEIRGVPPGTYSVEGWHEKLGLVSKMVTVKAGAVTTVDFSYASPETSGATRGAKK
jgi:plastocyanin